MKRGKFVFTFNLIIGKGIQILFNHMRFEVLVAVNIKINMWVVMPCSLVAFFTPKTEAAGFFEMLVLVYQTIQCHIKEDCNISI
jgi:hypothetical protein